MSNAWFKFGGTTYKVPLEVTDANGVIRLPNGTIVTFGGDLEMTNQPQLQEITVIKPDQIGRRSIFDARKA